jgi:hypothetical protein
MNTSLSSAAQAARVDELLRAYQRILRRKSTVLEAAAMSRAALLTARAEVAALDPAVSVDDLVRIDGAASRARTKLADLIGGPTRRPPPAPRQRGDLAPGWFERKLAEAQAKAEEPAE